MLKGLVITNKSTKLRRKTSNHICNIKLKINDYVWEVNKTKEEIRIEKDQLRHTKPLVKMKIFTVPDVYMACPSSCSSEKLQLQPQNGQFVLYEIHCFRFNISVCEFFMLFLWCSRWEWLASCSCTFGQASIQREKQKKTE